MRTKKIAMDEVGFKKLMHAHLSTGDMNECIRKYYKLWEYGLVRGNTGLDLLFRECRVLNHPASAELFRFLKKENIPSTKYVYPAVIKLYTTQRQYATVVELFDEIAAQGIVIQGKDIHNVLHAFTNHEPSRILDIHAYMDKHADKFNDIFSQNALIIAYSFVGNFDACISLINNLPKLRITPNITTYNTIINQMGKFGNVKGMMAILEQAKASGVALDEATYRHAIFWLSKSNHIEESIQIMEEALAKRCKLNVDTISEFMRLCNNNNAQTKLTEILTTMKESGMGEQINKALVKYYSKEGDYVACARILSELEGTPDVVDSFDILVQQLCSVKNLEACFLLLAKSHEQGMLLSPASYSDALILLANSMDVRTMELLDFLWSKGVEPSMSAYATIMNLLSKNDDCEGCYKLYDHIREKDIPPTTELLTTLLYIAGKNGGITFCEELFEIMCTSGPFPSEITYGTMLMVWSRYGKNEQIDELCEQLERKQIQLTVIGYNILIHHYSQAGSTTKAKHIFAEMKKAGVQPDAIVYHSLILRCCRSNDAVAFQLLREMREHPFKPSLRLYTSLLQFAARVGDMVTFKEIVEDMEKAGVEPDYVVGNLIGSTLTKEDK